MTINSNWKTHIAQNPTLQCGHCTCRKKRDEGANLKTKDGLRQRWFCVLCLIKIIAGEVSGFQKFAIPRTIDEAMRT